MKDTKISGVRFNLVEKFQSPTTKDEGARFRLTYEEGEPTPDGRQIDQGATNFDREPPLPVMLLTETSMGHDGAKLAGAIDKVGREGDEIWAEGFFDSGSEEGREAERLVREEILQTWSPDIGDAEVEFEELEGSTEMDPKGILHLTSGTLLGGTIAPFPALDSAKVALAAAGDVDPVAFGLATVIASYPTKPPKEWFTNPNLDKLQRYLSIENGRVFGHAAGWKECHLSYPNLCLDPPQSGHDYAYFQIGQVETASGELVETGPIALKGGHASLNMDHRAAQAHYDDPSTAIADVVLGEDDHGIWFSGALRPEVSEEDVRCFRASGVSGDWRKIGDRLELVGICSVNVPGYPKVMARVASGEVVALVAAGGKPEGDKEPDLEDRVRELEAKVRHLNPSILESLRVKVSSD